MTPITGYHVANVTVDGSSVRAVSTYSFHSGSAGHTISASFAINTYTLTASTGANGTVSPAGTTVANYGDNDTYTITPSTGYQNQNSVVYVRRVDAGGCYTIQCVAPRDVTSRPLARYI